MYKKTISSAAVIAILMSFFVVPRHEVRAAEIREITFPVLGGVSYTSSFGAPRVGHTHEGNDIFAPKGRGLVAAVDGTIRWVAYPEPSWGWGVEIEDADGWRYRYLHLNNDTPGTDDGQGGGRGAYAPGMISHETVKKGQLIGFVGDSGNAETTSSHLHFEIRTPDDVAVDPYPSLQAAHHLINPVQRDPVTDEFFAYGPYEGGANVAVGNVLDTVSGEEIVTGALAGGGPNVRVFNSNGKVKSWFFAYAESFRGGIDVATGDIDGDGRDEIITGAGPGGGPHVRIFDAATGKVRRQFFAYDQSTRHGIRVAAADLDGDGKAEIITAPVSGAEPLVRVFKPNGTLVSEFMAYAQTFHGGVDVAAYPATNDSPSVIVTGAGDTGGSHVRVMNATTLTQIDWFFAYDEAFRRGVKVSVANQYGDDAPEIFTVPAGHGGPDFKVYSLRGARVDRQRGFEEWWTGSFDIAAGSSKTYVSSGPGGRQVSVWELD